MADYKVKEYWKHSILKDGSKWTEMRYCIVEADTGIVLDDAQGHGYTTAEKALASYRYKNR